MHPRRMTLWRTAALLFTSLAFVLPASSQVPAEQEGPLTANTDTTRVHLVDNADIVRMAKAGLSDDILIQTIQTKPGHYDTAPDDLIALKADGVHDRVIAAMEAHGTGLLQREPSNMPGARMAAELTGRRPEGVDEIGVYYRSTKSDTKGQWLPLQTERLTFRSSGTLKSVLSQGVLGKDTNGFLDGRKSALVLPTGIELMLYTPAGTDGNEYYFLRLRDYKDHREFRTLTGGVFHETAGPKRDEIIFQPKRIAPQLYTFTVPIDIEKGEYGVLPPGSANTQGIAGTGKIYTFSITE